jgi:hypothetical protein
MAINLDGTSRTIDFRPQQYNILWDGTSYAKASLALACDDTAASHAAVAYPVWGVTATSCGGSLYEGIRGARKWTFGTSCQVIQSPDISLPLTVSSGVATIVFSGVTATGDVHGWQLTSTKNGNTRVIAFGRIEPSWLDVFGSSSGGSTQFVEGATAVSCF